MLLREMCCFSVFFMLSGCVTLLSDVVPVSETGLTAIYLTFLREMEALLLCYRGKLDTRYFYMAWFGKGSVFIRAIILDLEQNHAEAYSYF